MADENTPAFYPRVGRNIAKNFRSAQPPAFIEDPRAMDLPQYGDVDLSVPNQANLEMSRRMAQRQADLKRQQDKDRSPLEQVAGALQTGRFMGSALTQAINSMPTRIAKGDEAADKFMQERMYQPTQPLAYEYTQDIGDMLGRLETEYKIPPVLPEAMALQYLTGPATSQAARATGRGAEQVGRKIESAMEPVVKGAFERGGLPREMVMAMGANTQSNVLKQRGGNYLGGERIMTPERYIERLMTPTFAGETPAQRIPHHEALLTDPFLADIHRDRVQSMLNVTKGEAALDQWAKSNLLNYYKNDLATPNDPVRQFIDKNYADIEAKYVKDQERAARMAQRAEQEPDPRRKANLTRQAQTMRNDAQSDYQLAMDNVTHLPREDLADVDLNAPYLLSERKQEGFPEQGMGVSDPARRYETLADESLKISRAGDLQRTVDIDSQVQQSTNELRTVEDKINNAWTDFLRGKGLDEQTVITLNKMPTFEKAQNLGMADELQLAQNKQGQFFQINNSFEANAMRDNPFVSKLDPETKLYTGSMYGLGFDHVMDVLRQDVAEGRIRPEQLNKLSVEQAVRRTAEYNLERAKTMRDAKLIQQEGFKTYKDYPDQGYKWIELAVPEPLLPENYKILPDITNYKNPDNELYSIVDGNGNVLSTGATEAEAKKLFKRKDREQQLADALKYEGDTMGHCVGGYCPDVIQGKSKIYSLRDAKGEPHVTIEVEPQNEKGYYNRLDPRERIDLMNKAIEYRRQTNPNFDEARDSTERAEILRNYLQAQNIEIPPRIKQIKGKQNAKPIKDYIPFVQDFVRSGNWSEIGDFKNTDLISADTIRKAGWDLSGNTQKLFTKQEYDDLLLNELNRVEGKGMKAGGKVSISNNPDTMMMELGNKRMKEGGSEDDTKPYFGGAGTKKYAPAKKRAEDADVNLLKDPRTYATVAGFMGERPDEMGFSVLHPDYQGVREAADPAFYAGTALGIAPLGKALNAPFAAIGKALDPAVGRFVTKTMERGGLGADILTDMGQGTRSYVHLPHTEKSPDPTVGTRYKRTDIGGLVPRKDLDIEKLDKSSVKVFPWDASDRNKLVTEVSDIPLTKPVLLEGGDNYMRDIKHVKKRIAGASNEGIANRIQDRIDQASVENQILGGTGKVFGFPIRMADKAEHASTFPTDIAMDLLKQGNLSRKELDDLTNELRGMSFEAKGKGYFQNVAPIDSPEFLVQLREGIKGNKEKGITSVTDMNLRRALMDRLSQKKFQKRLEYNYPDLIGSVIADELKGVPKGWVGNVSAELDPFSKIRPSKSSTYSHDFGGKYYASMPNMPVEFLMPNTFEGIYREMKALYPSAKPEALRNMAIGAMEKRKENISEMIGSRSIDAVKLYQEGLKQGEFDPNDIKQIYDYMRRKKFNLKLENVKKAEGGAVTGDDLIIEERPL